MKKPHLLLAALLAAFSLDASASNLTGTVKVVAVIGGQPALASGTWKFCRIGGSCMKQVGGSSITKKLVIGEYTIHFKSGSKSGERNAFVRHNTTNQFSLEIH